MDPQTVKSATTTWTTCIHTAVQTPRFHAASVDTQQSTTASIWYTTVPHNRLRGPLKQKISNCPFGQTTATTSNRLYREGIVPLLLVHKKGPSLSTHL